MIEFFQREWKFFVVLLVCLAVLGLGYAEYRHYLAAYAPPPPPPPTINISTSGQPPKPGEPQVVYVQGTSQNTREIVYVPKEIDPATGEKEKTDVQFEKKQGKVYVKVNGKDFEVPADVQENAKFENGKLVVTEETQMRLNITTPKPAVNLGLGWSLNGPAMQINGPLYKNVSWWVYGDKKTVAGGLQFPINK